MSFDQDQTIGLFYEVAVCYMHKADDNYYVSISRQKDISHRVGMGYKKNRSQPRSGWVAIAQHYHGM